MKQNNTHLGHSAKKRFGQNFLIDQNIIMAIVNSIYPQNQDNLIEIGPGLGALTEPVAEQVDKLTVIEVDRDLAHRLRHHPFLHQKLNVIESDVLNIDFNELASTEHKAKVFGNLPYNISTPLILHLLQQKNLIAEMTFMLQKEVIERICACPNSKQYGRLSIIVQYFCQVFPVIEVPPESFKPAPKVQSAVVKLVPYQEIAHPVHNIKALETVTALAFGQRRKTIKNSLSKLLNDNDWLKVAEFGIETNLRAENISIKQYIDLTNYIIDNNLLDKLKDHKPEIA